ncbi:hypothetical protein [Planotetraspora sp. GP83]|uniref:hypothetical protein n=1 Tax=Planotetraspora sp. GP83 TaxID=3156264 RepID=UPI0035197367
MRKSGWRLGRALGAALAAALIAGLVSGAVARLLMRAVALAMGKDGHFSLGVTVGILVVFAVLAVPAAATATARPAISRSGRWATAALTGWACARTGVTDGQAIVLADDGQLPLLAALIVAFAVVVVAHGRLAQQIMRRFARLPYASPGAASGAHPGPHADGPVPETAVAPASGRADDPKAVQAGRG